MMDQTDRYFSSCGTRVMSYSELSVLVREIFDHESQVSNVPAPDRKSVV